MGQTRAGKPDKNKTDTGREKKGKTKADRDSGQEKRVAANEAARSSRPRGTKAGENAGDRPGAASAKKKAAAPDRTAGEGAARQKATGRGSTPGATYSASTAQPAASASAIRTAPSTTNAPASERELRRPRRRRSSWIFGFLKASCSLSARALSESRLGLGDQRRDLRKKRSNTARTRRTMPMRPAQISVYAAT